MLMISDDFDSEEAFTPDSDNEDESQQECVKYPSVLK